MRWLALGGALVGLAFLTKMLQAFLVLPALALAYLFFARTPWGKRIVHLLVAFGSMLLAGGWWVAIVALWPASSRPYIGGSQNNSILELTLGYNGFGRLTGNEIGSVGGGGGRRHRRRHVGQHRPLPPVQQRDRRPDRLAAAGRAGARRSAPSGSPAGTTPVRAALILWLGWLLVTGLTFSFMAGIFHAYYTVALAPAVAALVGIGAWLLWQHRRDSLRGHLGARLHGRADLGLRLVPARPRRRLPALAEVGRPGRRPGLRLGLAAGRAPAPPRSPLAPPSWPLVASLAGPAAYAVEHRGHPHTGSIPSAGPSTGSGPGGMGGPGGGCAAASARAARPPGQAQGRPRASTRPRRRRRQPAARRPAQRQHLPRRGHHAAADRRRLLHLGAAAVGSNTASGYQLASQQPVMAIGGFNGSDPSPTLAQFEAYVANGQIHYFIASGGGAVAADAGGTAPARSPRGSRPTSPRRPSSGVTLYDLSGGTK